MFPNLLFIVKRMLSDRGGERKISRPILKIAIGSVVLSVLVMIVSVAAGKGMQEKIREKISAFSGHILIVPYNSNQSGLTLEPVYIENHTHLKNLFPEIQSVVPYATIGGLLQTGEDFEGIIMKGVDSGYDWSLFRSYLKVGKIPDFSTSQPNDSLLLSGQLASKLKLNVGDKVWGVFMREGSDKPMVRRFKVGGIYETEMDDYDRSYIIGDLRMVKQLYKWPDTVAGGYEIRLKDFDRMEEVTQKLNEHIDPTLVALHIKEIHPFIFDWLDMFDFNLYIIIGILILVSALNMATVLLVLIAERTRFIGLMKTLGASNRYIISVFLLKAAWFISVGLFIGNLIALGLIWFQQKTGFIKLDPETYYVQTAPFIIHPLSLLYLNVGVLLMILLLLVLPALFISQISPSKVMKFE